VLGDDQAAGVWRRTSAYFSGAQLPTPNFALEKIDGHPERTGQLFQRPAQIRVFLGFGYLGGFRLGGGGSLRVG
jgi:hypothetical protein